MKSFIVLLLVAYLAVSIKAQRDYITCASDKFVALFEETAFIHEENECIDAYFSPEDETKSDVSEEARGLVRLMEHTIEFAEFVHQQDSDSVEKYDGLYRIADKIVSTNNKLLETVDKLGEDGETLQKCINTQVERINVVVDDAKTCTKIGDF